MPTVPRNPITGQRHPIVGDTRTVRGEGGKASRCTPREGEKKPGGEEKRLDLYVG